MFARRFCFVVALALWTLLGVAAPVRAADAVLITVTASDARPDFPNEIVFSLSATASDAEIVAVQLLYGATRDEALTIVDLEVGASRSVELEHRLDTQVYYYPPGTEITYRWSIRDSAGNELASEPQEFIYHDQRFAWEERSERNVTVYWYRGGAAFGDELIGSATGGLDRLQSQLNAQLPLPVRIYVYANNSDMRSALQSNEVEWVGGQAWPGYGVIVGGIEPGDSAEIDRLIAHELSHQVLHQATDNPYGGTPVWFDEGLAVHNQEQRDIGFDEMVAEAAEQGRLIPLEALTASFPADPDQALLSYAQSRDVVEHIINNYGEPKLRELAQAFASATPLNEALEQAIGLTVDELDAEWRATLPPQTSSPPPLAGPQTAPDDRFDDAPASLPPSQIQPQPAQAPLPGWQTWLSGLPAWATISATALCCVSVVAVLGVVLLIGLRLLGVDKQTS